MYFRGCVRSLLNSMESIKDRLSKIEVEMIDEEYKGLKYKYKFKCKTCGKIYETSLNSVFNQKVYNCRECSYVIQGSKRKKENLSLEQLLYKLEEINVKLKVEKMYKNTEKTIFLCKTCGGEYESNLYQVLYGNRHQCKKCTDRKHSNEYFLTRVKDLRGEDYTFLDKYISSQTPITVKHNICGYIYKVTPDAFLYQKQQCPKCQGKLPITIELAKEKLSKMEKSKDYEIIDIKKGKTEGHILSVKHILCGNVFETYYSSFIRRDSTCPVCNGYKNETKIFNILKENNINFKTQYRFEDCKYKNPLPFDFAIFDNNNNLKFLIEYQGEQHYKPINFGGIDDDKAKLHFDMTVRNDKIKYEYCKNNNIDLKYIPYTESKNIKDIILKLI